ncbi:Asp-tRNA(Asn)/Glu-tRNA(Gln) amidotransferase subunit GatC [Candidatus Dojkabacteria bacterium]|uniref:Aspartyl/glutamyl-tRNA(Asn/Gln) amidotransferase subunit C n=1 Tax=Candidatus Dojkabacteria bacterium TaxID=2099670 RepID=A0A955L5J8_9BACT|nr:Asp-tRNA(Asn)/Glu-tRNA(Gln) amidotransferase subunit GatC [Candidatus Dojkabacteria bacterium]
MAKLTKDDIKKVADLIKIHIPEEELDNYLSQLETALDPVNDFEELDTKGVAITSQTIGTKNINRKDEVKPSLSQRDALLNGKNIKNGYFTVQQVINDGN